MLKNLGLLFTYTLGAIVFHKAISAAAYPIFSIIADITDIAIVFY
jgi:hypothetical protein